MLLLMQPKIALALLAAMSQHTIQSCQAPIILQNEPEIFGNIHSCIVCHFYNITVSNAINDDLHE